MENVLLHSCCAPCSAAIVEWMLAQDIRPTLYYFNPNIFPQEEYEIRKSECSRYAQKLGLEIIDGDYDHTAWLSDVAGLEDEPERGKRCLQCFKIRTVMQHNKSEAFGIPDASHPAAYGNFLVKIILSVFVNVTYSREIHSIFPP